ncbi:biotin--[acetyl-CoA-carboxylase] ligase [Aerosakkonema funiforme]|uniref:biotin--[acetyl-CoA-carboxylase] ligase n=2 Tax=Oscillatoriophycideae TaxID=1301283 RepID=UPI002AC87589|nr:biotin--[acetyl-CoA-carboxylase] ligase [Aerosakkonema funiforme]
MHKFDIVEFDRQQFAAALESVRNHSVAQERSLVNLSQSQHPDISLHLFETLPSTNEKLWELLALGSGEGTTVIAIEQQAGRGQWGRQWHSSAGGLYLSVALTPNVAARQARQLTMCGAWGIATILREYDLPVSLKWPNDLILSGRKLGGILTETRVNRGRISKAVVGVGINLTNQVPENGINLVSFLANHPSPTLSLETLAAITLVGLMSGYHYWQQKGIDSVLPFYQNLLTSIGRSIEVNGRSGVVVGVSVDGDLRVCLHPTGTAPSSEICLQPGTISLGYGEMGLGNG